jgi:hypothetical protein
VSLLDPASGTAHRTAETFEGFFFAAEDSHGPFLFTQGVSRGEGEGGEWAAGQCLYPYPTDGLALPGRNEQKCT